MIFIHSPVVTNWNKDATYNLIPLSTAFNTAMLCTYGVRHSAT